MVQNKRERPLLDITDDFEGTNVDMVDGFHAGNVSGQIPVSNGIICPGLYAGNAENAENADTINGCSVESELSGSETAIPRSDAAKKYAIISAIIFG